MYHWPRLAGAIDFHCSGQTQLSKWKQTIEQQRVPRTARLQPDQQQDHCLLISKPAFFRFWTANTYTFRQHYHSTGKMALWVAQRAFDLVIVDVELEILGFVSPNELNFFAFPSPNPVLPQLSHGHWPWTLAVLDLPVRTRCPQVNTTDAKSHA